MKEAVNSWSHMLRNQAFQLEKGVQHDVPTAFALNEDISIRGKISSDFTDELGFSDRSVQLRSCFGH